MSIATTDLMALDHIQELVQTHLAALRFFPSGLGRLAVARLIAKLVDSVEEARRLCEAIVEECDTWPGPATVRRRYAELFHFEQLYPPAQKLRAPRIQCQACQDWGRVRGPDGKWTPCSCTPEFPAGILATLNRAVGSTGRRDGRPILPPVPELKPITEVDLDRILAARAAERRGSPTGALAEVKEDQCRS